jgi:hypothetical protein
MTDKYEAGRKFLELVLLHPEDFKATEACERDGSYYTISNIYRGVSAAICDQGNALRATRATNGGGSSLIFMDQSTMKSLVEWASKSIAKALEDEKIKKDNDSINTLLTFYRERAENESR